MRIKKKLGVEELIASYKYMYQIKIFFYNKKNVKFIGYQILINIDLSKRHVLKYLITKLILFWFKFLELFLCEQYHTITLFFADRFKNYEIVQIYEWSITENARQRVQCFQLQLCKHTKNDV